MKTKIVRTTIRLPWNVHRQLRLQAVETGITISDLVIKQFTGSRRRSLEETLSLFDEARKSGKQLVAWKAVRAERDAH